MYAPTVNGRLAPARWLSRRFSRCAAPPRRRCDAAAAARAARRRGLGSRRRLRRGRRAPARRRQRRRRRLRHGAGPGGGQPPRLGHRRRRLRHRLPGEGEEDLRARLPRAGAGRDPGRALLPGRQAGPRADPAAAGWRWACPARCAAWPSWCGASARRPFCRLCAPGRAAGRAAFPPRPAWPRCVAAPAEPGARPNLAFVAPGLQLQGAAARGRHRPPPGPGATLRQLRASGPEAFYRGAIAREIVAAVKAAGGVLTADDLEALHRPRAAADRDRLPRLPVFSMPPPSSGGIVIAEALGILSERVPDPRQVGARIAARTCTCWPRRSNTASPIGRACWATPTS